MNQAQIKADAELIEALGGPAQVAELLGYDKQAGGVQRVHNWLSRGIPAQVKVNRPDIFLDGRHHARAPLNAAA